MNGRWFAVTRTNTGGLRCAALFDGERCLVLDLTGTLRPNDLLLDEYRYLRGVFSDFTEIDEAEAHRLAVWPTAAES